MATKQKQAFGQRSQNFEKKLVGIVTYKTGTNVAKFTLTEEGKTFKGGEKSIKVNFADLPKYPKLEPNDSSGKQLRIRMSSDGSEVEALTPVVGMFPAKLVDIGPRPSEDADPAPREKVWNEGTPKENRYWEFFNVYEITSGKFKGVRLPALNLHYKFEEDDNNPGYTRFAGSFANNKATRLLQLRDVGILHGWWDMEDGEVVGEPIPWDDETILPELLERGLEHDAEVNVVIKGGYIIEVLPSDGEPAFAETDEEDLDAEEETEDEFDKKYPPKKSPAKAEKKPAKKVSKKSSDDDDDL